MDAYVQENNDNCFYVGLCMAGAVSAGAYTAGVMDYLVEALTEWEKRKNTENITNVPQHTVKIPVIGGASAGGMTSIITAGALQKNFRPIQLSDMEHDVLGEHPQNPFYHHWVDMLQQDMLTILLDTADLKSEKKISSLLNASFIDAIAKKAIIGGNQPLPSFMAANLKILVTLTNLEGYQTNERFKSEVLNSDYYMAVHNDYACYELKSKNHLPTPGWQQVNMNNENDLNDLRNAAMATGAFPAGLKSRILERDGIQVIKTMRDLAGITPMEIDAEKKYISQHVDGGVMDNEPFAKIKKVLSELANQTTEEDLSNYHTFNHTLIMIDPFPAKKNEKQAIDTALVPTLLKTLGAMLNQSRIKPELLQRTINPKDSSLFMISPSRKRTIGNQPEEDAKGEDAIACGSLGGFGGFIHKEFRVHDYFLGRHNCKVFLKKYFTIPLESLEKNELFKKGYAGVDLSSFTWKDASGKLHLPIIPLFETYNNERFDMPIFSNGSNWPQISSSFIDQYTDRIKKRISLLVSRLHDFGPGIRFMITVAGFLGLWKKISLKTIEYIQCALQKNKLLDEALCKKEKNNIP